MKGIEIMEKIDEIEAAHPLEQSHSFDGRHHWPARWEALRTWVELMIPKCGNCGGELSSIMLGDEVYDHCSDCGWTGRI